MIWDGWNEVRLWEGGGKVNSLRRNRFRLGCGKVKDVKDARSKGQVRRSFGEVREIDKAGRLNKIFAS